MGVAELFLSDAPLEYKGRAEIIAKNGVYDLITAYCQQQSFKNYSDLLKYLENHPQITLWQINTANAAPSWLYFSWGEFRHYQQYQDVLYDIAKGTENGCFSIADAINPADIVHYQQTWSLFSGYQYLLLSSPAESVQKTFTSWRNYTKLLVSLLSMSSLPMSIASSINSASLRNIRIDGENAFLNPQTVVALNQSVTVLAGSASTALAPLSAQMVVGVMQDNDISWLINLATSSGSYSIDCLTYTEGSIFTAANQQTEARDSNVIVSALSEHGVPKWHQRFSRDFNFAIHCMDVDADNLLLGGHYEDAQGQRHGIIAEMNQADGDMIRSHSITGDQVNFTITACHHLSASNQLIIGGQHDSFVVVGGYHISNQQMTWVREYSFLPDRLVSKIQHLSDSHLVVSIKSATESHADAVVLMLNPVDGQLLSATSINAETVVELNALAIDQVDNQHLAGNYLDSNGVANGDAFHFSLSADNALVAAQRFSAQDKLVFHDISISEDYMAVAGYRGALRHMGYVGRFAVNETITDCDTQSMASFTASPIDNPVSSEVGSAVVVDSAALNIDTPFIISILRSASLSDGCNSSALVASMPITTMPELTGTVSGSGFNLTEAGSSSSDGVTEEERSSENRALLATLTGAIASLVLLIGCGTGGLIVLLHKRRALQIRRKNQLPDIELAEINQDELGKIRRILQAYDRYQDNIGFGYDFRLITSYNQLIVNLIRRATGFDFEKEGDKQTGVITEHGAHSTIFFAIERNSLQVLLVKVVEQEELCKASAKEAQTHLYVNDSAYVIKLYSYGNFIRNHPESEKRYIHILSFANFGDGYLMLEMLKRINNSEVTNNVSQLLLVQFTEALDYLAKCNVYHGDIKPDNVMFHLAPNWSRPENWLVKLIDFGCARHIGTPYIGSDDEDRVCGEIASAERINHHLRIKQGAAVVTDFHAYKEDIWGFGLMLFYFLTLTDPYQMLNLDAFFEREKCNEVSFDEMEDRLKVLTEQSNIKELKHGALCLGMLTASSNQRLTVKQLKNSTRDIDGSAIKQNTDCLIKEREAYREQQHQHRQRKKYYRLKGRIDQLFSTRVEDDSTVQPAVLTNKAYGREDVNLPPLLGNYRNVTAHTYTAQGV